MNAGMATAPSAGIPVAAYKREAEDQDGHQSKASFVLFVTDDGCALFTRRSEEARHPGEWDLPGGGVDEGETDEQSARRESIEEIGVDPGPLGDPFDAQADEEGVDAVTFLHRTERFIPVLNPNEHDDYVWAPLSKPPEPLHRGVQRTFHAQKALGGLTAADGWLPRRPGPHTPKPKTLHRVEPLPRPGPHASRSAEDAFPIGAQVKVKPGKAHHEAGIGKVGKVVGIGSNALAVRFEGEGEAHRWYTEEELDRAAMDEEPEVGEREGVRVDRDHDGPWMSVISKDGQVVYVNKNLPQYADIKGKSVNVDDLLVAHEVAERAHMARLAPDGEDEAVRAYEEAHEKAGIPAEHDAADAAGVDWDDWNAWCRGEEAKLEKGPFENEPPDAHVRPVPHRHGELMAATDCALQIALDRASVRDVDLDGRMHVGISNISKANVCPYRGREIPGYEELGLEPDTIYQLYRHPEELARAAPTFNRVQLLKRHIPVSADDHKPYDVIGTTGSDCSFEYPFLRNSLTIWAADAIDEVKSGEKRELSCGYHYVPDMTPGVSPEGESYDGVMRNIIGNHVAIVEEGRAGSDVVVGDSVENLNRAIIRSNQTDSDTDMATKPTKFANLALQLTMRSLRPVLAADAKINLMPIFAGVTSKTFDPKAVYKAVEKETKGKLAKDASVEHLMGLLDHLEPSSSDESVSGPQHRAMAAAAEGNSTLGIPQSVGKEFTDADRGKHFSDALPEFLRSKGLDEGSIKEACDMAFGSARDEEKNGEMTKALVKHELAEHAGEDEFPPKKDDDEDEEKEAKDNLPEHEGTEPMMGKMGGDQKQRGFISQQAFDAALEAAKKTIRNEVRQNEREIRLALDEIRPHVGELRGSEYETPKQVYAAALKVLGFDEAEIKEMNKASMKAVLKHLPKASSRASMAADTVLATDASSIDRLSKKFPGIENIKVGV